MLHIEIIGGFGLITAGVATRVVFGHSGGRHLLTRLHVPLPAAAILILLGLGSRVSGDFVPRIQLTHYLYGAECWLAGMLIWSWVVLPRALRPDPKAE